MPSVHKKKTFETLQEQVKRWSGRELNAHSRNDGLHGDGYQRRNPFSGAEANLDHKEAAVYDLIIKIEMEEWPNKNDVKVFDMMRYWFMAHNSKAYSTLLD